MSRVLGIGMHCAIGDAPDVLGKATAGVSLSGAFANQKIVDTPFVQGILPEDEARDAFTLAFKACRNALDDAGVNPTNTTVSLVLATGAGDTLGLEQGQSDARPYDLSARLAEALDCRGVFLTVTTACSASSYGASLALDLIEQGHDHVLLCGVEAKSDGSQYTFKSLMALDPKGCFPFSERRNGTVLGAGAAALLLGPQQAATKTDYGVISAASLTCDGYHDTAPDPEGKALGRGINIALDRARCLPKDIDLFLPHATGTRLNDEIEQSLLDDLFGARAMGDGLMLLKSQIGHTCGASSAFSMIAAARAFSDRRASAALIGASAFGGNNASVVMRAQPSREVRA